MWMRRNSTLWVLRMGVISLALAGGLTVTLGTPTSAAVTVTGSRSNRVSSDGAFDFGTVAGPLTIFGLEPSLSFLSFGFRRAS